MVGMKKPNDHPEPTKVERQKNTKKTYHSFKSLCILTCCFNGYDNVMFTYVLRSNTTNHGELCDLLEDGLVPPLGHHSHAHQSQRQRGKHFNICPTVLHYTLQKTKRNTCTLIRLSYKYIQIKALTVFKGLYLWYTSTSWQSFP